MATERLRALNRVCEERSRRGWSQDELSRRSGLSRAGVSAVETGRLVPSAGGALALASAFGVRVEDLFWLSRGPAGGAEWAWAPPRTPCRYWRAEVAGRAVLYPVEPTPMGVVPHDGVVGREGEVPDGGAAAGSAPTLVMACCDPAVGLLAEALARTAGVRLLALPRSSRAALALLGRGLVHAAGVHLSPADRPDGNAEAVRGGLGEGYSLLRAARWEEGVAVAPGLRVSTVADAVRSGLRWVGREDGSGARQCLDDLLGRRKAPRRLAADHRGVAEAVRAGWADAGVCLRLTSEEAGLTFLSVRDEAYDLCVPDRGTDDPVVRALVDVVRSAPYRKAIGELPGYDSRDAGGLSRVK